MSSHTTVRGKSRKVATLLNGPRDNDCVAFDTYVTISAGAAATTVLIADSQVPSDWYIYLDDYKLIQPGTAWTAGTDLIIHESTASSAAYRLLRVLTANMPTTAAPIDRVQPTTRTGITEGVLIVNGLAAGKGISMTTTGTHSGSAMTIRLKGVMRPKTAEVFG